MACMAKRGLLTLRDCDNAEARNCANCGRPMCHEHLSARSGYTNCLECAAADPDKDHQFDAEWAPGSRRGCLRAGVAVDIVHFDRRAARPELRRAHLRWPLENDPAHTINCAWNRARTAFDLRAITHVAAFGGYLPLMAAPAFAAWIDRPLVTL